MKIKDLKISELTKFSKDKLNSVRREVLLDNELIEIPSILLPDVFESSYYFVSYSHNDFRLVYQDIIALEEGGLNIWYDRGIPAGKNWKEIANDFMFPSECRGVIFYLSENSLLSSAVIDEIKYAKKLNKTIVVIMLPYQDKYYSACQLATLLGIDNDKVKELETLIPDELLYIPYNQEVSIKIEKIVKSAPDIPPFECATDNDLFCGKGHKMLVVTKLNNYKIGKVDESILPLEEVHDRIRFLTGVCANAQLLESIDISPKYGVEIGNFSFYGCKSLSSINIEKYHHGTIGEYAFAGCSSLKELHFDDIAIIHSWAFSNCANLKSVTFGRVDHILENSFKNNKNLKSVDLGRALTVRSGAFANCPKLKDVKFSVYAHYFSAIFEDNYGIEEIDIDMTKGDGQFDSWVFASMHGLKRARLILNNWAGQNNIAEDLFFECENLESVTINFYFDNLTIENYAFSGCFKLKEVNFNAKPKKICRKAFFECKELDTLFTDEKGTLDLSSVTELEDRVFVATKFKKVILGKRLKAISYDVFNQCEQLEEIYVNSKKIKLSQIVNALGKSNTTHPLDIYSVNSVTDFKDELELKEKRDHILNVHCSDGEFILEI